MDVCVDMYICIRYICIPFPGRGHVQHVFPGGGPVWCWEYICFAPATIFHLGVPRCPCRDPAGHAIRGHVEPWRKPRGVGLLAPGRPFTRPSNLLARAGFSGIPMENSARDCTWRINENSSARFGARIFLFWCLKEELKDEASFVNWQKSEEEM